ncbi:arylsulfotransferase family protein [Streptomyces iconiensis]|uniref:Arylsulfotransferase family protein n=1 Tax=Streptomyces iconiensis TaxID=1384038 RepID=A0ABT7ACH5_9ACTN|nr:arylsulfotransferase family protein [Streptomyces iconiensis]MDJ1138313.1 arylsulfotransferase family protein [Streptomyces iconiensis]
MRRTTPLRAAFAALGSAALLAPLAAGAAAKAGEPDGGGPLSRAPRPDKEHITSLSRPDLAREAPALSTIRTGKEDDRLLLTDPGTDSTGGIGIYANNGDLVWWQDGTYTNLNATTYKGEPVLSAYKGSSNEGSYVLLDSAYREVASFAMKGYSTDVHDFQISPDGKRVLLLSYDPVSYDLSEHGGPADATVTDAVIQEQDIGTGEVTFEWSALDHIPITETQVSLNEKDVDYVHFNSLAYEPDGTLLASARHSSTVYKIDMADGKIVWRLGGENSDFTLPRLADAFSFQHDARRLRDGSVSVFDNGNLANPQVSRGAVYKLDGEDRLDGKDRTAALVRDLQPHPPQFGSYVGSSNEMLNGNQLVSYGNTGEMAEFQGEEPVWAGAFPEGYFSYRAQRADWKGTPAKAPDVTLSDGRAAVSWNGATEVDRWRISAGGTVKTVEKDGFETRVTLPGQAKGADPVRVSALDERGEVLGTRTVRR